MNIINRALTLGLRIKEMVVLSLFALFGTFSEIIGLGVFYPIFEYMNMGGDINALTSDSQLWVRIVQLFNALGIKVSLFLLFLLFLLSGDLDSDLPLLFPLCLLPRLL